MSAPAEQSCSRRVKGSDMKVGRIDVLPHNDMLLTFIAPVSGGSTLKWRRQLARAVVTPIR
jgi:hypothetical protein